MPSKLAVIIAVVIAIIVAGVVAAIVLTAPPGKAPTAPPALKYGPWLQEIKFKQLAEEKAVRQVAEGIGHAIVDPLRKPEDIEYAERSPSVKLIYSICGAYDILVNPVPCEKGFNPFTIPEVREALQYLVDRDYVVSEILHGYAIPIITHKWPGTPDYDRIKDFMKKLESKYRHNITKAKLLIEKALKARGCELKNGKWYCNGKPVVIKIFIRTEDFRRQVGDYLASLLEQLGFTVERKYATAKEAIPIVYAGDPRKCEWHLYTEGWGWSAIEAYPDADYEYFCCSSGSGTIFYYYKPPEELVEAAKKLSAAEYKSLAERAELVKKVVELDVKQSVRIWLFARKCPFAVYKDLHVPVYDTIAGLGSLWAFRTAYLKEKKVGGSITVYIPGQFLVSAWNPIGGETWVYDVYITQYLWDRGVYTNPWTGEYIPFREVFEVETAGPTGKLKIPSGTIIWDPKTRKWVETPYKEATSKIIVRFVFGKWHHGVYIDLNDVLAWAALLVDVATNGTPVYDPTVAGWDPLLLVFVKQWRGVKIVNSNTIEIYIDYWHPDKTMIARFAEYFWPKLPYEIVALIYKAVGDRKLALSDAKSQEWGVPWLDLARGDSLNVLKSLLEDALAHPDRYIPDSLKGRITADDLKERLESVKKFLDKYGHMYISNGPFMLLKIAPEAKEVVITAFREGYPFKAGYFEELAIKTRTAYPT